MKNSKVLWLVLGIAGLCAACTMMTAALATLGLLTDDTSTPPVSGPSSFSSELLPRGETPDLFPGSPGWLPSGRGVELPDPSADDSGPRGLWWSGSTTTILFLGDGTRASNPRPGGGALFDIEGQRRQPGTTGVGTFHVEAGSITQRHDGFTSTHPYDFGDDSLGPYMNIGAARYRPLSPPTE
ncbi:MAG: hypothetical protein MUC96_37705, partial [Myxococcaceae bacterium]|nr:hypothetical protein [Myxococcaceae bacterium]